jgi:hypothetical protein
VDETGDSLFRNAHPFYRDALKPGPQLDSFTINFLHHLKKAFDEFEAAQAPDTSLFSWSKMILCTASTNAMMGPALLRDNPDLLPSVWLVESGFFFFVNRISRMLANKNYRARDHVRLQYFEDETNKERSAPIIWDREVHLRAKGMITREIAAYSYSAYAVCVSFAF